MINRSHFPDPAMVHGLRYAPGDQWLNVGCGLSTPLGFFNTDLCDGPLIDQVVDLMDLPLPWENDQWDFILASHILEHIPHHVDGTELEGDLLVHLVNEFIRVLKTGGILEIHTPIGPDAMYVIDHCRFVDVITFRGWDPDYITTSGIARDTQLNHPRMKLIRNYIKRGFRLGKIDTWHTRHYLGLEVGRIHQNIMIYQVIK